MNRKRFILPLFLLLTAAHYGQQAKQYTFMRFTTAGGLISNQVNSLVQDSTGYIWIGTTDGLQRFDGIRYKTFQHKRDDIYSLPYNPVSQIRLDKDNNLWVLLANGQIGKFDTRSFRFTEIPVVVSDPRQKRTIKKLFCDEQGHVFLLMRAQVLLMYKEDKNEFSDAADYIRLPKGIVIGDMSPQPGTSRYWISIQGGPLAVYDAATGHFNMPGNNPDHIPAVDKLGSMTGEASMYFDHKGRMWFITWGSGFPLLHCFDLKTNTPFLQNLEFYQRLRTYHEVHDFFEQQDGTLWVKGLNVFARFLEDKKDFQLVYNGYLNERSIHYDGVTDLVEDREHNIWVSTRTRGLYQFNPANTIFSNYSHMNRVTGLAGDGDVMSCIPTRWGTYLVGTWGDGLYHYDKDFNVIPTGIRGIDPKQGPFIWSMFASKDSNTIWMSAQPGFYALNQATKSVIYYNPPELENRTIRQIAEDRYGNVWLGMQHIGLFKWSPKGGKNGSLKRFTGIPETFINKLMVDHLGYIWAGTSSEGLYMIDPATDSVIYHFNKTQTGFQSLPEEGVSSILDYNDSLVLISTSGTVSKFNRVTKRHSLIGTSDYISGFIASMERDNTGYVWVSTTAGLYRVNVSKKVFVKFNREDGIDNDNFYIASSRKLPDGRIYIGSGNQFVILDPSKVVFGGGPREVTITDFRVLNKSLRVDSLQQLKEIRLGPSSNSIAIDFTTMNFSSPYLVRYKLEGLDKDWRSADMSINQAVYSYLPPGKYRFLLSTVDSDGMSVQSDQVLVISVKPPFWKAWWFYMVLLLFAAILLYRFDRERMKRKESIQRMRADIAGNLHEKINTALGNINILSEMARIKAERDPQKSIEYIEQIHTKSHNMIIALDDMLWSIDHSNDSMKKTVDRMKEYVDSLNSRHKVHIQIHVDPKVESLHLNMKLRYESFLMFKEGIKNLVNTGVTDCLVDISYEKGKLVFDTQFANENCNLQELNNLLHRQDLEKKLEALGARISIGIHKNRSGITLQIPVN